MLTGVQPPPNPTNGHLQHGPQNPQALNEHMAPARISLNSGGLSVASCPEMASVTHIGNFHPLHESLQAQQSNRGATPLSKLPSTECQGHDNSPKSTEQPQKVGPGVNLAKPTQTKSWASLVT